MTCYCVTSVVFTFVLQFAVCIFFVKWDMSLVERQVDNADYNRSSSKVGKINVMINVMFQCLIVWIFITVGFKNKSQPVVLTCWQKYCVDDMETPESIFACLRRNKDEDNFDRKCMKMIVLREELRAQG